MCSFLCWSFVKSYWRLCFKMVMLQLAPLPSPAGASTALWAWKVSAERLTFGGWTVSFISVTVWLITALSSVFSQLCMVEYVLRQLMRSADNFFFFFSGVVNWKAFSENFRNLYRVPYSLSRCPPLWDYIQRLQRKWVKATEEEGKEVWCRGSLALMTSKDTAEATVSMRLEEASNVHHAMCSSCLNLPHYCLFYFMDSLFFTIYIK